MKKRLLALRAQKSAGVAMVLLLCAAAVFLALTAALVYSASVLTASANQRIQRERCYQLAKSFSAVLEQDLCIPTPPADANADQSVYGYANKFLDGLYNLYDPDKLDQTKYSYGTTASTEDAAGRYGAITVTLFKEEDEQDAGSVGEIRQTFDTLQSDLGDLLNKFEETTMSDFRFSIQVTATQAGHNYTYTTRYYRMVQYEAIYETTSGIQVFRLGDQFYTSPEHITLYPLADGKVVARYDTDKVIRRTFTREGD